MPLNHLLTVVIPAHRAELTLARAIEAVQRQPESPSIIVVVDGRFDQTEAIARNYDNVEVLINEKNLGVQRARNQGLAAVNTEFVTFLDADDYIEGDLHEGMVRSLERDDADIVFSTFVSEWASHRGKPNSARIFQARLADIDELLIAWFGGPSVLTGAVAWRTSSLKRIGGWNPEITKAQDFEIGLRSIVGGMKATISLDGLMIYVNHDGEGRVSRQRISQTMASHESMLSDILSFAEGRLHRDRIRRAVGERYYTLATMLFADNDDDLAREALQKARRLGFHGHSGSLEHRLLCGLLGLETKQRFSKTVSVMKRRFTNMLPALRTGADAHP